MSARWDVDGEAVPVPWWQAVGVVLVVSGVLPLAVAQLVWFVVTGDRMGGS